MKKVVILSVLTALLTSSVAYATHLSSDDLRYGHRQQIVKDRHHVVHVRPHRLRPHRRHTIVRRPHYVRLHHRIGHRIHRLRPSALHLSIGGLGYRYNSGVFYRPYRNGYRVVRAPLGAVIGSLPVGHRTIFVNNHRYYQYEDTYYNRCDNGYRVIEEPTMVTSISSNYRYQVGDIALNLPAGAMEVIIDNNRYYEAEGQYFKQIFQDGKMVYKVVTI